MNHAYWGPGFSNSEINAALQVSALTTGNYTVTELPEPELLPILPDPVLTKEHRSP